MKNKLNHGHSQASEATVGDQKLHDNSSSLQRGNSVNRTLNACENYKLGYNGTSNGGSDSHKLNGENTMNTNTDVKLDAINTKIDSNEKVMYAELSRQKSYMDGRFEAVLGEIKTSRAESQGFFQSVLSEIKAIRAESQGQFQTIRAESQAIRAESQGQFQTIRAESQAIRAESQGQYQTLLTKIEASEYRTRLWVIFTGVGVVAGSIGLVAAAVTIWVGFTGI